MVSQGLESFATMKLVIPGLLLSIISVCVAATWAPGLKEKFKGLGLAERTPAVPEILRLTGTLMGVPVAGVTVIEPFELFTGALDAIETVTVRGVGPLGGLNSIQPGKLERLTVVGALDVMVKVCDGGVTPAGVVNVSEAGLAVNVWALAVSKQHTSANMSAPNPNKAFLVVFKTPPLRKDVRACQKDAVPIKRMQSSCR